MSTNKPQRLKSVGGERATHTPGPWRFVGGISQVLAPQQDGGEGSLEVAYIDEDKRLGVPDRPERYANGRLIAAAPELLDACKWMADFIRKQALPPGFSAMLIKADEAIAKAEGRA